MSSLLVAADRLLLHGRHPEVDRGLLDDLHGACLHALWGWNSMASQDATIAYVDGVVGLLRDALGLNAPEPVRAAAVPRTVEVDFRLLTVRAVHLGKGAWSDAAVARMESWLAAERPELAIALLRELCLAAYVRHQREGLTPTRASMLAWIGQVVPRPAVRGRQRRMPASVGQPGRPKGSGRVIRNAAVFRAAYDRIGAGRSGQPTQREVAAELGISVRTLQTRLRDWGIRWGDLP